MAEIVPSRADVIYNPANEEGYQITIREGDYAEEALEGPVEEYLSKHSLIKEIVQTVGEVVKAGGFLFIHYSFICKSIFPYILVFYLSICNEIFSTPHLFSTLEAKNALFRNFRKTFSLIRSIFVSSILIIVGGFKVVDVIYYKAIAEELSYVPYSGVISIFSLIIYFIFILSKISPTKEKVSLQYVLFGLFSFISLGILSYLLIPTLEKMDIEDSSASNIFSSIPLAVLSSFFVMAKESRKSKSDTDEKFKNTLTRTYTLFTIYGLFLAYGMYARHIHHSLERTIPSIDVFSELDTALIRLYSDTDPTKNSHVLRSILSVYDVFFLYFTSKLAIYHLKNSYLKTIPILKYSLRLFNREESSTSRIIFQVISKTAIISIISIILGCFLKEIPSGDTQRAIAIIGGIFGIFSSIYRIFLYRWPNLSTTVEVWFTLLLAILILMTIRIANDLSNSLYREV